MSLQRISVVMAAYNHERYVREAVTSVLDQTHSDLEVIVVNDGSTDGTASILNEIRDPRLKAIHQKNAGVCESLNRGISETTGDFIALMSGDDACMPHRLETQLREYQKSGRCALFSHVQFIDDNSQPLHDNHWAGHLFNVPPPSRGELLRRFFKDGNFLNAVTFFTAADVLRDPKILDGLPVFDPQLIQLQDFELWIRLAKVVDVRMTPEKLVRYRIREGGENQSAPHPRRTRRARTEHYLVLRRHLSSLSNELFRDAFAMDLVRKDFGSAIERKCEEAFLLLKGWSTFSRLLGIETLSDLLSKHEGREGLERHYHFTAESLCRLMLETEIFSVDSTSTLYWSDSPTYTQDQSVSVPMISGSGPFELNFELPTPSEKPLKLRWDPLEHFLSKIRIDRIEVTSGSGGPTRTIPLSTVGANGRKLAPGSFDLTKTLDPMIFFDSSGPCHKIRLVGEVEVLDYRHVVEKSMAGRFF